MTNVLKSTERSEESEGATLFPEIRSVKHDERHNGPEKKSQLVAVSQTDNFKVIGLVKQLCEGKIFERFRDA